MAVALGVEAPFYLEVEVLAGAGVPHTRVTVYNVPGSAVVQLRWASDGESGIVQGVRAKRVTDVGVFTDWAVPLGRPVSYWVVVDGESFPSSLPVTVASAFAWLQDPLDPAAAIAVSSTKLADGLLMLDSAAIGEATYANRGDQIAVMGEKLPLFSGGVRAGASGVQVSFWSDDALVEAAVRRMVAAAPVLLFRPLPQHRMLPPSVYLAGDMQERQVTVRLGGDLTHWSLSGNLVQAVLQAALTGSITYQQVQDLLGGYTYGEIQAAASSTAYLDWQKNPLIFSSL